MKNTVLKLILKDGTEFIGTSFGFFPAAKNFKKDGEVVFNTGMAGYPESLTDPSYRGQILVFTYPLVGNYGVPEIETLESRNIHVRGVIVSEYCESHSHWQARRSLADFLKKHKIPAIQAIDTRALTRKLREHGVMLGKIAPETVKYHKTMTFEDPNLQNLVAEVSCDKKTVYAPKGKPKAVVAAYDCGMKENIIRSFVSRGIKVIRLPWNYDVKKLKGNFDALFISNGPGNPKMAGATIEAIRHVMRETEKPIFGICLGAQLLALAAGADTYKLKYGHRSCNQPCVEEKSGRCIITSQNHGFAVKESTLPKGWKVWFKNANDGTVEGIRHVTKPWRAVQFHPEAAPGPEDANYLFDEWIASL